MENIEAIQMVKNFHQSSKSPIKKDFYESEAWVRGNVVCGLDEVGRGCLSGPLVVAAVILLPTCPLDDLKDSKIMSQKELQSTASIILKNSLFSYAIASNSYIDKHNILNATILAMRKAVLNLFSISKIKPNIILVDAIPLSLKNTDFENIEIQSFAKGESLSSSIAAASIIAKVKRDNLMEKYERIIPNYNLSEHKGYGTQIHKNALLSKGESILHRKTFLKNFTFSHERNNEQHFKTKQQSIFF